MHRKKLTSGFAELVILLAGLTGITVFGILQSAPKIKASQASVSQNTISHTPTPDPTSTITPTIEPDHLISDEVLGVGMNSNLEISVNIKGEPVVFSLVGLEKSATSSAECIDKNSIDTISQEIKGKRLYVVTYDTNNDNSRYVFLEDDTLLNKHIIKTGLAIAQSSFHPFYNDFIEAQKESESNKLGIWSDSCLPSPTPTLTPVPSPTMKPTATKIPTNTPTATPTLMPTQKLNPTKTPTPTQKVQANIRGESTEKTSVQTNNPTASAKQPSSLSSDVVFDLINAHRKTKNLVPFEKDENLCKIAASRVPQLHNEIFGDGYVHEGFQKLNLSYWIVENMAGYGSEKANVNWWLGSTIHRNAIEGDFKYSCGACSGSSCVQLFTSYMPK